MGTFWSARVVASVEADCAETEQVFLETFNQVVSQMSPWEIESDLSRYRRAKAGSWVPFSEDSFFVLEHCLKIAAITEGRYDPTVGMALDLLGFGPTGSRSVDPLTQMKAIRTALAGVDYRKVSLDKKTQSVFQPGGVCLDLCSIAKGYAVDLAAGRLEQVGFRSFLIEVGGEIRGKGCKPDGQPWWCELEPPSGCGPEYPKTVAAMCDLSLATSGNSFQKRQIGDREFGHILSLDTTDESPSELLSVSVFHPSCMTADAYATALFLLGKDQGLEFARDHALAALFVWKDALGFRDAWSPEFGRMLE